MPMSAAIQVTILVPVYFHANIQEGVFETIAMNCCGPPDFEGLSKFLSI